MDNGFSIKDDFQGFKLSSVGDQGCLFFEKFHIAITHFIA